MNVFVNPMRKIPFVLFFFISVNCVSQNNIGVKFFGLSVHPFGDKNAHLMPNKLDKNAYFVVNLGGLVSVEKHLTSKVSVKVIQALYADCAAQLGGFSHIGIRFQIFNIRKHRLSGGIGPTLVFRKNWQLLENYDNPNTFKGGTNDQWQYLFLWYGGEFEYKYPISEKVDFALSFVPGYPDLMNVSFGVNYNF